MVRTTDTGKRNNLTDTVSQYRWKKILSQQVDHLELITGYEGNAFASTGDVAQDLLSITCVHPMRAQAVADFLTKTGAEWTHHLNPLGA